MRVIKAGRQIDRHPSQCPRLEHRVPVLWLPPDRHWNSWTRETETLAKTHGVSQVFDLKYEPRTNEEKDLFALQCDFVESIFNEHVHTAAGRNIVSASQEQNKNGREILVALHARHETSSEAHTNATILRNQIVNLELSKWTGTTSGFLNHWNAKLSNPDVITDPPD